MGSESNKDIAQVIPELLEQGSPLILATIIAAHGSSPRHLGTKMVIGSTGQTYSTIGGSLLEATVIQKAQQALVEHCSKLVDFDLAGDGIYSKGMICGGKLVILLDYVMPTKDNISFFRKWCDAIINSHNFFLLTYFNESQNITTVSGHTLLFLDGSTFGNSPLSTQEQKNIEMETRNVSVTSVISMGNNHVVADPIAKLKTLYCFGAGHVAVPTAHVAALVGFRVVIVDDRAEMANAERFPDASEIHIIHDFNRALAEITIDEDSFIIIVTRGHQFDREVLEQSLHTKAGYIGMISSRSKRDAIYQALLAKGIRKEVLEQVHSPIGVDIGSETPEEIAVSIVAELIRERARRYR